MERRSFLGTVTGLAATAVVGGLPALAGGKVETWDFNRDEVEFLKLQKCESIMLQRVADTGKWEVWGYLPGGGRNRVCVTNCDEQISLGVVHHWIEHKVTAGCRVASVSHTPLILKWRGERGEYMDSCNGIGIDFLHNYYVAGKTA